MNRLTVYSQPDCSPCAAAMKALDRAGVPYEHIDVSVDAEAKDRLKRAGLQVSPVFGWRGALRTIAELPQIIREAKEQVA